ncbi:hypothetical protein Naga_100668g3 [Nannochloropsis gaditana]|uniref:Uncharacterized protein n=1 Tax=Nannochloropsis gaditana TaxID=72520 RepID=W7THH6_9STRA|nr:hypothetical protein Naga_100668g3 [Nannochloropsis gaditana]
MLAIQYIKKSLSNTPFPEKTRKRGKSAKAERCNMYNILKSIFHCVLSCMSPSLNHSLRPQQFSGHLDRAPEHS